MTHKIGTWSVLGFFALAGCGEVPEYKPTSTKPVEKPTVAASSAEQTQANTPFESEKTPAPPAKLTCESGSLLKIDMVRVVIPKNNPKNSANRCPFGKDDNNSTTNGNGKFSARIERKFPISIPDDRQVCGLKASGQEQTLEYDDHLFLTLNDNLLIATGGIPSGGPSKAANGFLPYDWTKFRGKSIPGQLFCADGVTCKVPGTQQTGKFSFELSDDGNKRLFTSLSGQSLFFNVVLSGDNDPDVDCLQSADIILDVSYTYVPK